jgi:hypothetical protein
MAFATATLILSTLLGTVVGTRLNVLALVSGAFIVLVLTASADAVLSDDFSSIALALFLGMVGLQVGYVAGSAIRPLISLRRLSRLFAGKNSTAPLSGSLS